MEVTDLRVGNLIYVSSPDNPISFFAEETVEKCHLSHLMDIYNGNIKWSYKPIPISKEWLNKFGLDNEVQLWFSSVNDIFKFQYKFNVITETDLLHIDDKPLTEIKYVHQLQNIFYFITGRELEYKLETE